MLIIPTEKRFDWKHAPVVLFVLVILNTVIFFGYQFGDDEKIYKALVNYKNHSYLEKEWPIYKDYLISTNQNERLEKDLLLYEQSKNNPSSEYQILYHLVSDSEFYAYLESNSYDLFSLDFLTSWSVTRVQINNEIQSISTLANGLIPSEMGVFSLITHQFLHGGIMHLLGNMFFLIICGFAVEAAIGHLRFFLFYIVSGIGGGLLFAFMDITSTTPLVGASGAISGVMAMYLGVFRFKKIEFFYWFIIFVGYFRAPALLILPFYIGKELYSFFNETGTNVAFMAHTGGFFVGTILMALTYLIKPEVLNEEYIEEDQNIPKLQKDLEKVYNSISKFRFSSAIVELDKVIHDYGCNFERLFLRYKLLKIVENSDFKKSFVALLTMQNLAPYEMDKLITIWENDSIDHATLNQDDVFKFGWNIANNTHYRTAESIFVLLNNNPNKHKNLGMFAKKLSVIFGEMNNSDKKQHYELLASELKG